MTSTADLLASGQVTVLASDQFTREITGGWGNADQGGAWTAGDAATRPMLKVTGGQGLVVLPSTSPRSVAMRALGVLDGSGILSFSIAERPDNPLRQHTVDVYARRRSDGAGGWNYYRFRIRIFGNGTMDLRVEKKVAGLDVWVTSAAVVPSTWQPGVRYRIRWDCFGSSPATTVRARVWRDGEAEPDGWQVATTVNDPELDIAGGVGLRVNGPSEDQVTYPINFAFDDLTVFVEAPTTETHPPVAAAGGPYAGVVGSPIAFDGSGSHDPNNDVPLRYHWTFGDGGSSDLVNPTHTYAAAGTYTATLTVTDAHGLVSEPASASVTVEANDALLLVRDRFSRTASNGWGSADVGGLWVSIDEWLRPNFRVNGSVGQIVAPDASGHNTVARSGYGMNVAGIASFSIDNAPDGATRFHQIQTYARRDDRVGDGDNYYRFHVRVYGSRVMHVRLEKRVNKISSWLSDAKKIPLTFVPGATYWVRWEAVGVSPATTIRMRVWPDGTAEPAAWDAELTLDEPGLDRIGTTGFRAQAASSEQVTWPVTFSLDNLEYRLKN